MDDGTLGHRGAALLGATMELSGLLDPEGALRPTTVKVSPRDWSLRSQAGLLSKAKEATN